MAGQLIEHVADLRRRSGTRREVHRALPAHDVGVTSAHVPDGADITIDGAMEAIANGVVVDATVAAPWVGECRRCLTDIGGVVSVDVLETFEPRPTEGETWPLHGDTLDLAPMVRETALLGLPLAPLCADDCKGPAPDAFPARAADEASDAEADGALQAPDPRWAALDELRSD